jgi:hypothetical protein
MPYTDHFRLADDMVNYLDTFVATVADDFIKTRYIGFVSVSAVTAYELAIKDIFNTFAERKHTVLGNFVQRYFVRLNGRIKLELIRNDYLVRFGDRYQRLFQQNLEKAERESLEKSHQSIVASYDNIIEWRNQFAHEGSIPQNVSYAEAIKSYGLGKTVISCLAESMQ